MLLGGASIVRQFNMHGLAPLLTAGQAVWKSQEFIYRYSWLQSESEIIIILRDKPNKDDRGRREDRVDPNKDYPQTTENRHGSVRDIQKKGFWGFLGGGGTVPNFFFFFFCLFLPFLSFFIFLFFLMCLLDRWIYLGHQSSQKKKEKEKGKG